MLAYPTSIDRPRIIRVEEIRRETETSRTIFFRDERCLEAKPGQFVMIWAMGADEMPMSLSAINLEGRCAVTVKPWGPGSTYVCNMKPGEVIGLRGPYGIGFSPQKGSALLVGGGTGVSPLLPLSKALLKMGAKITLVLAGKTGDDLLLVSDAQKLLSKPPHRVILVTDDGSIGLTGQAPEAAKTILEETKIDQVYMCGPEIMMRKIFNMAEEKHIPTQASLERAMDCAVGLCGLCVVGKYLVCRDGPVFSSEPLKEISEEFGFRKRDRTGRPVPV